MRARKFICRRLRHPHPGDTVAYHPGLMPLEGRLLLSAGGHAALPLADVSILEPAIEAETHLSQMPGKSMFTLPVLTFTQDDCVITHAEKPLGNGHTALSTLTGWQWPASRIPLEYYVNTAVLPPGIAETDFVAAVDSAFQVWANVGTNLALVFHRIGTGTEHGVTGARDGVTTIGFGTAVPGALAHATTYVDDEGVTEFDVVLGDDRAEWSIDPFGEAVDVWSAVAHEVGHGLGLAHTDDPTATMYLAIASGSTHQRDPNLDDINGLRRLYGNEINVPPTAPTSVAATDIANESSLVTWAASTDGDGDALTYQVDFRVTGTTEWTTAGSTSQTSIALTSLTPNTRYDVRVTASDGTDDTSSEVLELFATTYGTPAPPSKPSGISASDVTDDASQISWNPSTDPNGQGVTYKLRYKRPGSGWADAAEGLTQTSFLLTDLAPETTYSVRLVASDGDLFNGSNAINLFTTTPLNTNTAPTPPDFLKATEVNHDNALVSWGPSEDANHDVVTYTLQYRVSGEVDWLNAAVDIHAVEFRIENIDPATTYDARIVVSDGVAAADLTATSLLTTLAEQNIAPTQPGVLTLFALRETSVGLHWEASVDANGTTVTYQIQLREVATDSWTTLEEAWPDNHYDLADLTADTTYDVKVIATDGVFTTTRNGLELFTTITNQQPSIPSGLVASEITGHGATMTWQAAEDLNFDPLLYSVFYREHGTHTWIVSASGLSETRYALQKLVAETPYDVRVLVTDGTFERQTSVSPLFTTGVGITHNTHGLRDMLRRLRQSLRVPAAGATTSSTITSRAAAPFIGCEDEEPQLFQPPHPRLRAKLAAAFRLHRVETSSTTGRPGQGKTQRPQRFSTGAQALQDQIDQETLDVAAIRDPLPEVAQLP